MLDTNLLHQPCLDQLCRAFDKGLLTKTLLLSGSKGIGKHLAAQHIAAHILNQTRLIEPQQPHARTAHPDLIELAPADNAACISIDQIRELQHTIQQTTHTGKARVVILFPAESLNTMASNAMLKTLEAPDSNTYFILISHAPQQLLSTIQSRCHEIKLSLPAESLSKSWLKQRIIDADQQTIDLLMHFAFARPSIALQLHQQEQLSHYQSMYTTIVDYFAQRVSVQTVIDAANKQTTAFKDCYKRFIIDCIHRQHQAKQPLDHHTLPHLQTHIPLHTLSLWWQHIIRLESILDTTPSINLTLNLYVLLTQLANNLNMDAPHATC